MNFTLHQLRVYCLVVENQSITKASEDLHMTQPAVSIQLKNLQAQFDIGLTEVIGRKLYITEFGKELYQTAKRILREAEAVNTQSHRFKGMLTGKLTISVVSTGKYVMPYFLTGFFKENPAAALSMDVTNKSRVISSLLNNEVDFSLISVMPTDVQLEEEVLMPNKIFLFGPGGDTEAPKQRPDKSIFDKIPLIYREDGSGTRVTMQEYFRRADITPRATMELTSTEAVKQAVIAGLGYSVLSLLSVKNELSCGDLRLIPVKGMPLVSAWRLVWLTQKKLSPAAQAYLEYIKQHKKAIAHSHFSWTEKY